MQDAVWLSKNGPIKVKDMTLDHVNNALAHLKRYGISVGNKAAYDAMQRRVYAVEEFKREAKNSGAHIIDSQRLTVQCYVAESAVSVAHLPDFSNGVWVAEAEGRHYANANLNDLLTEIEAEIEAGRAVQALQDTIEQHAYSFATARREFLVTRTSPFEYRLKGESLSYVAKFDPAAGWVVAGDFDLEGKGGTLIDAYNDAVLTSQPEQSEFGRGLPPRVIVQYPNTLPAEHVRAYNEQLREWLAGDRKILVLPPGTKITPVYDAC